MVKLFDNSDTDNPANTELTPILAYSTACVSTTQTKTKTAAMTRDTQKLEHINEECLADISADHEQHNCLTIEEDKLVKETTKVLSIKTAELIKGQEGFN